MGAAEGAVAATSGEESPLASGDGAMLQNDFLAEVCAMVKIQKCKRHGVCNDCGKQQSEEIDIWEIRASVTGQGWNTLMLCNECMLSLHTAIAITVTQQS